MISVDAKCPTAAPRGRGADRTATSGSPPPAPRPAPGRGSPDRTSPVRRRPSSQRRAADGRAIPGRPEFVVLDCDERRFRLAHQPGNRPRVRVALLEVIERGCTKYSRICSQVPSSRRKYDGPRPSTGSTDKASISLAAESSAARCRRPRHRTADKNACSRRARRSAPRIPLPAGIDPGEAAVVQLVADVEGQLHIDTEGIAVEKRAFDGTSSRLGTRSWRSPIIAADSGPRATGSTGSNVGTQFARSLGYPGTRESNHANLHGIVARSGAGMMAVWQTNSTSCTRRRSLSSPRSVPVGGGGQEERRQRRRRTALGGAQTHHFRVDRQPPRAQRP